MGAHASYPDLRGFGRRNPDSRRLPGAVIHDPQVVAERAVQMAIHGRVTGIDGRPVTVRVESLCGHGDTPGAVDLARGSGGRRHRHRKLYTVVTSTPCVIVEQSLTSSARPVGSRLNQRRTALPLRERTAVSHRSLLKTVPVLLLAGVLASACGGGKASGGNSGGKPVAGGTVVFAERPGQKPDFIFPMMGYDHQSIANIEQFSRLSYRSLYWVGKDGKPDIDYLLSLANEPVYSDGNKTVTVTLKDYNWSDGTPVTSRDVELWYNLLKANKASVAGYIKGAFPDNVTSFTAEGPKKFVMKLDAAYSPQWFTYNEISQLSPLPQHVWDKTSAGGTIGDYDRTAAGAKSVFDFLNGEAKNTSTYGTNPLWKVVNGPWVLSTYRNDGYSEFTVNKQYSGPNKPHIDKFVEQPFTSEAAELNVLRAGGKIDYGYLPVQESAQQKVLEGAGYTVQPWDVWGAGYFVINFNHPTAGPLFKQTYIRQSLQSLINQDSYVKGPLRGYGDPSYGPIGVKPANSFLTQYDTSKTWPFNADKAVQMLTAHGWSVKPNGVSTCQRPGTGPDQCGAGIAAGAGLQFTLEYSSGLVSLDQEMQAMKSDFSRAGVDLKLTQAPFNTVLGDVAPCKPNQPSCKWEMINWGGGWIYGINPYPSGDQLFATDAGSNYGGYSNPEADKLISANVHSADPQAIANFANFLANDVPVLWTPHEAYQLSAISNRLKNAQPQSPILSVTPEDWQLTQ